MYILLSKYADFGEFEQNTRKIENTHQDTKNIHISETTHVFPRKKNMCFISEKYTHNREIWWFYDESYFYFKMGRCAKFPAEGRCTKFKGSGA